MTRLAAETEAGDGAEKLRQLTVEFCDAGALAARLRRAGHLFAHIWSEGGDRPSGLRLTGWLRLMEQDAPLRERFRKSWALLLGELNGVPLLADAGLPARHGLLAEISRRLLSRVLPTAREATDAGILFTSIFSSTQAVARFVSMPEKTFERLAALLWPTDGVHAGNLRRDLRQALRLLATRIAGRGVTAAVRERGTTREVHDSPFYRLVFATEILVASQEPDRGRERSRITGTDPFPAEATLWREAVRRCRLELVHVHRQMEEAGVSSALVYDLRSIEAALDRMELLGAALAGDGGALRASQMRELVNTLVRGRVEDTRLSILFRQSLNLLARKTVERTGRSGEHYVARDEGEYWRMWRSAAGGGLLTVLTAAIKLQIVGAHFPLFVEGFLVGTDYAVTFVVMQVLHLALATKQPSMTAAALAGIVRENRGVSRWSKISDYAAQISRTQLAAAFGNVIAVCLGGIVFEEIWIHLFGRNFLSAEMAAHAYRGMNPLESGTAIFAAFTGVILWLGGMAGGWAENFVVFNRIPEAIVQHPLGIRVGIRNMHRLADWLERNVAGWSNSIVLGYLLGMSPVVARFFGIPLDVRHVTLNTGMVALAAAQFGASAFRQSWLYWAAAGVAVTFVLNLGVSFSIASIVALRAYNVPRSEQAQILGFILREFFRSPAEFLFPRGSDSLEAEAEGAEPSSTPDSAEANLVTTTADPADRS